MVGIDGSGNIQCNYKLVFVSSQIYYGNLGGASGADSKCNSLAATAGLSGTFKAWVSTSSSSPNAQFNKSTGPYMLTDLTTVVAQNYTDLTDGTLQHPIDRNETNQLTGDPVWTGTNPAGTAASQTCQNWSSISYSQSGDNGSVATTGAGWTSSATNRCNVRSHIYCFQQ